eukprot:2678481-Prymnesium_polylepis.1
MQPWAGTACSRAASGSIARAAYAAALLVPHGEGVGHHEHEAHEQRHPHGERRERRGRADEVFEQPAQVEQHHCAQQQARARARTAGVCVCVCVNGLRNE